MWLLQSWSLRPSHLLQEHVSENHRPFDLQLLYCGEGPVVGGICLDCEIYREQQGILGTVSNWRATVLPGRPIIETNNYTPCVRCIQYSIGSTIVDLPLGLKFKSGLKEMITRSNSWALERDQFWRSFEEEKLWLAQAMSFDSVASRT